MSFEIITKNNSRQFDKEVVVISSNEGDFIVNFGFNFSLTVQYDSISKKCIVLNQYNSDRFLFKGQNLPVKLEVDKMCKIMVKDSDEFISIKLTEPMVKVAPDNVSEQDIQGFYGNEVNAGLRLKIEKRKSEIEEARVQIIKQVSYQINDFKNKISMNSKTGIITHIALLLSSFLLSFGLANYLCGLPLKDAGNIIQMPVNLKLVFICAAIIYGVGLVLKQGIYLTLQDSYEEHSNSMGKVLSGFSFCLFGVIYLINVLYYNSAEGMTLFAIFISFFFTAIALMLSFASGHLKSSNLNLKKELNKYEYREDFEHVTKEYQQWIERYVNNLTPQKFKNIQEKQFMLQIKMAGELLLGILTAPFLAYGVSNTLASCFPEAAGWIRISGLRFSPVFLVLATFMIIFAFFAFVNAFQVNKKIQGSNVLKNDGFSNYLNHGVQIYGLSGSEKLNRDMRRSFIIGLCIIFIEFSMNVSYFGQEIGGDLQGMFLSCVAALVPTALLIAETYMMSGTKFEADAISDMVSMREV